DAPQQQQYLCRPVGKFHDAKDWAIDALILTRDTHTGELRRRIESLRAAGRLEGVRLIDQPAQSVEAMLAHLGTYEPGCPYSPQFVAACQSAPIWQTEHSTLLCTLDAEVFPWGDREARRLYSVVMREFTRLFQRLGFKFTLCVQIHDTPG